MNVKTLFFAAITVALTSACTMRSGGSITHPADYESYLSLQEGDTTSKYFALWDRKIQPDSMQLTSFAVVGGEYERYFRETGDIAYLKRAEQALRRAAEIAAIGRAGYYRALARNLISQHRFREAYQWAQKARATGAEQPASQALLFDITMELGEYDKAEAYLDSIKQMELFGYLIRLAKWNDHQGDLESAIRLMEKATGKAEAARNPSLKIWSYSNLADFYGHAGRIRDSYTYYLKTLALDPNNAYAKKGIAWIVFSHEDNPSEAMRILDSVTRGYQAPDVYLLKSEIAAYMGDDKGRLVNLDQYFRLNANPAYGEMYNAHNIDIFLDETGQTDRAFALAQREVSNRPTPESYSLLAYCLFRSGDTAGALQLITDHVEGKSFEPKVLMRVAAIYKALGLKEKLVPLKEELATATYELGPLAALEIEEL